MHDSSMNDPVPSRVLKDMDLTRADRSAAPSQRGPRRRGGRRGALLLGPAVVVAALVLAACGGSSSPPATTSTTTTTPTASASTSFSTTSVPGLGTVLVDGNGRTVYELSSATTKNLPCTSSNYCIPVWIPLPLPAGTSSATASGGASASLLSTISIGGATYPTYNGWVLYEYSGDTGTGQADGQDLSSYGGTWHAIDATGNPFDSMTSSTTTTTYHY
jgi:hypothetical protein